MSSRNEIAKGVGIYNSARTYQNRPFKRPTSTKPPSPKPLSPIDDINASPQSSPQSSDNEIEQPPQRKAGQRPVPQNKKQRRFLPPSHRLAQAVKDKLGRGEGEGTTATQDNQASIAEEKTKDAALNLTGEDMFDNVNKKRRVKRKYGENGNIPATSNIHASKQKLAAQTSEKDKSKFKMPPPAGSLGLSEPGSTRSEYKDPRSMLLASSSTSERLRTSEFKLPPTLDDTASSASSSSSFRVPNPLIPRSKNQADSGFKRFPIESGPLDDVSESSDDLDSSERIHSSQLANLKFGGDWDREDYDLKEAKCPMCDQVVDLEFYTQYLKDSKNRLTIRQQNRFCKNHKLRDAEHQRAERGYPNIDWDGLPDRLADQKPHVQSILDGSIPSAFREKLAEVVLAKNQRTLAQAVSRDAASHLVPGYYGPRGAKILGEFCISAFSQLIREQAASDKLIAFGGASGYVQSVLVPELATRLVMEDMNCNDSEARDILAASIEIGELLNDEGCEGKNKRKTMLESDRSDSDVE